MIIGIDASRAFLENRTGIEEYSYQVIKNLRRELGGHQVVLYIKKNQQPKIKIFEKNVFIGDVKLPENWKIKIIKRPYLWTQVGLSLEMLFRPVDVLFIPAHTVPLIHPKNTFVTIHGLEYEFIPKAYSFWERLYMRFSIKNSCKWAKKIIAVSKNTKKDLIKLYGVPENKITVVYEGYDNQFQNLKLEIKNIKYRALSAEYLLFIGRLEERKNVIGIIRAFEILKEKYSIQHKLVLAGKSGYGYGDIKFKIQNSKFKKDIIEAGFISEEEKWIFLKSADVFLFPTFYEGFGIPVLEAQSAGAPVVASNNSSIPEISAVHALSAQFASESKEDSSSVLLVNPDNPEEIAEVTRKLIFNKEFRNDIIKKGYENIKRFSWEKCAKEITEVLIRK